MPKKQWFSVAALALAAACGAKVDHPGDACVGQLECYGNDQALFCESGRFVQYACPAGCTNQGVNNRCDPTGVTGGPCPKLFLDQAACSTNGNAVKCTAMGDGQQWVLHTCSSPCAVDAGVVLCAQ